MVRNQIKKLLPRGLGARSKESSSSVEEKRRSSAFSLSSDHRRRSSASQTSAAASAAVAEGDLLGAAVTGGPSGGGGGGSTERRPTSTTVAQSINESESTSSGLEQVSDLAAQLERIETATTATGATAATAVSAPSKRAERTETESTARTTSVSAAAMQQGGAMKTDTADSGSGSGAAAAADSSSSARRRESDVPPPTQPPTRVRTTGHLPLSRKVTPGSSHGRDVIFDDPKVVKSYDSVPLLEITKLPRGGLSIETQAVGRVQFGIPPETIKDSMVLGLGVPSVYIVPVERFCREMGPALGVNLAEFEFPAYFNFFVQRKRCTLIVDSTHAEMNIRKVFSETLLGPAQFRREIDPIAFEKEDFADTFPREAIPNFQKELRHFRIMPDGKELVLETLLKFCHFKIAETGAHEGLGVPPLLVEDPGLEERLRSSVQVGSIPEDSEGETPLDKRRSDSDLHLDLHLKTSYLKSQQARNASSESASDLRKVALKLEKEEKKKTWSYSQAKWIGDVATIYPEDATPDQIAAGKAKRCEIFKMPGGGEYILHDVDENNVIVGKARLTGHVKVSEAMIVDGFGGKSLMEGLATAKRKGDQHSDSDDDDDDEYGSEDEKQLERTFGKKEEIPQPVLPPTFHPPSFGVTVLGNSHGFDKSGSVSGYVLWINGRGVMIDPPPYSSATLEREGIRPRMIVGIIITHCHADHDAGTFQKVLTGSQVVVITTPTIYRSFIRKYSALSALSPALLRHSHRYKPAIIGSPLRFQGATFHFTYSLHTIPCVGFRVEWRGRSMVFTGDHFNSPEGIQKMEDAGTLSKERADDLRNLPLQDTDCLLHEAGAPPIHTPLDVLMKLPAKVKKRLYIVHTSNLPEDCDLKVAPTGTAGTIRLDQIGGASGGGAARSSVASIRRSSILQHMPQLSEDTLLGSSVGEYDDSIYEDSPSEPMKGPGNLSRMSSLLRMPRSEPPLVSLRPTSSTDAWFILNLLSAVPFLSSLSYASTMEVLETARVDAFCQNDIVVPAARRAETLVVVWEGTCMEREMSSQTPMAAPLRSTTSSASRDLRVSMYKPQGKHRPLSTSEVQGKNKSGAVWFAGDWTGPRALQPEQKLSGDSTTSKTHDVVAMSSEGVKVITIEYSNLHLILQDGSALYRKYLSRATKQSSATTIPDENETLNSAVRNLNIIELLERNSALRKLSAVQQRHFESLAEGPIFFSPGERIWRQGSPVDKAFIIVAGTASFVQRRRMAGSASVMSASQVLAAATEGGQRSIGYLGQSDQRVNDFGSAMRVDALRAIHQLGPKFNEDDDSDGSSSSSKGGSLTKDDEADSFDAGFSEPTRQESFNELSKLSRGLQKRANSLTNCSGHDRAPNEFDSDSDDDSDDASDDDSGDGDEDIVRSRRSSLGTGTEDDSGSVASKAKRRRSSTDRFANKVLSRLYESRSLTAGLVFSRGHFLGDVTKMVAGLLAKKDTLESSASQYSFGGKQDDSSQAAGPTLIANQNDADRVVHVSTLAAGKDGCVVLAFPKSSLIPFLNEHPGILLSLLGTQVVV